MELGKEVGQLKEEMRVAKLTVQNAKTQFTVCAVVALLTLPSSTKFENAIKSRRSCGLECRK